MILIAIVCWVAGLLLLLKASGKKEVALSESEQRFANLADTGGLGEDESLQSIAATQEVGRVTKFSGWLYAKGLFARSDMRDLLSTLDKQLQYAGRPNNWTAEEAIAWTLMFWGVTLTGTLFFWLAGTLPTPVMVIIAVILLLYPPLKLRQMRRVRQDQARSELPYLLQELRLNLSGGYSTLDDALGRTVQQQQHAVTYSNVLVNEFGQAYQEYRHGQKSRDQALFDVGKRIGVGSVEEFIQALLQGLHTGSPISEVLASQADMVSSAYKQDMTRYIQGKKPSFVVALVLVMMGVLAFIGGPIFLTVMKAFAQ